MERVGGRVGALVTTFALAVGAVSVTAAPVGAKGPYPSAVRAPATARVGQVITVRATIKGLSSLPGAVAEVHEPLQLRRVTRQRPLMWIGQSIMPVTLVNDGGDRYSARLTVPSTPGRYLFHTGRFRLWVLNRSSSKTRAEAPFLIVLAQR